MTKTKTLACALSALGWVPDLKHSARAALKGGKLPGFPVTAAWRIFPDKTGGARLSTTGKKGESRAIGESYLAKILAAAEAERAAVIDLITF